MFGQRGTRWVWVWVVVLGCGPAGAQYGDWSVSLTGDCYSIRAGSSSDAEEDALPCPPVADEEHTQLRACFLMSTNATLEWDFSDYVYYGTGGIVIEVNYDLFPGWPYMVTNLMKLAYGTTQENPINTWGSVSPLPATDEQTLPALPDSITFGEMDCKFHVYSQYYPSGPWNYVTTKSFTFRLVTVLADPEPPQAVPWWPVLHTGAHWMRFTDNRHDAVRQLVKRSWGVKDDGGNYYIDDNYAVWEYDPEDGTYIHWNDGAGHSQVFHLAWWLQDSGGGNNQTKGMCGVMSPHLSILASALGAWGVVNAMAPDLAITTTGFDFPEDGRWSGLTQTVQEEGHFAYHQVVVVAGLGQADGIYDPCICFEAQDGAFYVCFGEEDETRVELVLAWAWDDWVAPLWEDPTAPGSVYTPDITVDFYKPD